jgi:diacylglycerol diphosphate phosphatase/phosphatidate phosphatase
MGGLLKRWLLVRTDMRPTYNKRWYHCTYTVDWATFAIVLGVALVLEVIVNPVDRYLPLDDPDVSYPAKKDYVPTFALAPLVVGPPIIFALFQVIYRSRHDFHHATLGFALALSITLLITDIIKPIIGRYRPDALALIAEGSDREARLSFPSGHSSISWAAMTYLSLYLTAKLHVYSEPQGTIALKAIAALSPMVVSGAVACSRVADYHHHVEDVIAGSLLGSAMAVCFYLVYYPALYKTYCHCPLTRWTLDEPKEATTDLPLYDVKGATAGKW